MAAYKIMEQEWQGQKLLRVAAVGSCHWAQFDMTGSLVTAGTDWSCTPTSDELAEWGEAVKAKVEQMSAQPTPAASPSVTVTVRVSPSNFANGLRHAKRLGGRYDSTSKTWDIRLPADMLGALEAYGLLMIHAPGRNEARPCKHCGGHCYGDCVANG